MGVQNAAARHPRNDHEEHRPRRSGRPEISVPQLLGAALGAAAGMALASGLRLYGTTAGAVVFAVAATAGTSLIQLALHRAGEGCTALLRSVRSGGPPGRRPGAGTRRALVPAAVGLLLLGAVAAGGTVAVAAPRPAPAQRHGPSPDLALSRDHAPSPDHAPSRDQEPSRDPAERGGQDKVVQVRPDGRKSAGRRASSG